MILNKEDYYIGKESKIKKVLKILYPSFWGDFNKINDGLTCSCPINIKATKDDWKLFEDATVISFLLGEYVGSKQYLSIIDNIINSCMESESIFKKDLYPSAINDIHNYLRDTKNDIHVLIMHSELYHRLYDNCNNMEDSWLEYGNKYYNKDIFVNDNKNLFGSGGFKIIGLRKNVIEIDLCESFDKAIFIDDCFESINKYEIKITGHPIFKDSTIKLFAGDLIKIVYNIDDK